MSSKIDQHEKEEQQSIKAQQRELELDNLKYFQGMFLFLANYLGKNIQDLEQQLPPTDNKDSSKKQDTMKINK